MPLREMADFGAFFDGEWMSCLNNERSVGECLTFKLFDFWRYRIGQKKAEH